MMLSTVLALQLLASFVGFQVFHYVYSRYFSRCSLNPNLPWIGAEDGKAFSRARSVLRSFWHTRELVFEGYQQYSKKGLPFVLPNITTGPEVILPMSQMDWLLKQPDHVLSQNEVNRSFLQADYTMLHPKVVHDTVHEDVIRKEMTKLLGDYTADVIDEIDFAFRKNWGVGTFWTEVTGYYTMLDVIGRISNRVIVGFPLCRDEEYLRYAKEFARWVVVEAAFIAMVPQTLKHFLAPLIRILDVKLHRATSKWILPVIRKRLALPPDMEKRKNDYIQWSIDHSYANTDPSERDVDLINKRLSCIQFAAIQSSAITLANLALDLAAAPEINKYLTMIREEVRTELAASNGEWTKQALSRMVSLDSTLRESMRLWGFVSRGVLKQVVAKDGINLPSGIHLPCGTKVGIHAAPVHRDEDIYPDALEFKPFRFMQTMSSDRPDDDYSEKAVGNGKNKGTSLVTTSSNFMAFSHGKHACPGRFFAAQQLKLVLAYIALNYDIKLISSRPPNNWFVGTQGPPLDAKIWVRRRPGTHGIFVGVFVATRTSQGYLALTHMQGFDLKNLSDTWIFTHERVWTQSPDGVLKESRRGPRRGYNGVVIESKWNELYLAYFIGYNLWNYSTIPFSIASPGVESSEIEEHWEPGYVNSKAVAESWRVLDITLPDGYDAHTRNRKFYFDREKLWVRRMDSSPDVTGRSAAHYLCERDSQPSTRNRNCVGDRVDRFPARLL